MSFKLFLLLLLACCPFSNSPLWGGSLDQDRIFFLGHQFYLKGEFNRAIRQFEYLFSTFPDSHHKERARFEWLRSRVQLAGKPKGEELKTLLAEVGLELEKLKSSPFQIPLILDRFEIQRLIDSSQEFPMEKELIEKLASGSFSIPQRDRFKLTLGYGDYLFKKGEVLPASRFIKLAELGFEKLLDNRAPLSGDFFVASASMDLFDLYSKDLGDRDSILGIFQCLEFYYEILKNPMNLLKTERDEFPFMEKKEKGLEILQKKYALLVKRDEKFGVLPERAFQQWVSLLFETTTRGTRGELQILVKKHLDSRFNKSNEHKKRGSVGNPLGSLVDLGAEKSYRVPWKESNFPKGKDGKN